MKAILTGTLRSFAIMFVVILFSIIIFLPLSSSDNAIIMWISTVVGLITFLTIAYAEGVSKGEGESSYSERMEALKAKEGELYDVNVDESKCFSVKKGAIISSLLAVPVLIVAILAVSIPAPPSYYVLITEDMFEPTPEVSLLIGETPAPPPTLAPGATPLPKPGDEVLVHPQSWAMTLIKLIESPYLPLINMAEGFESFLLIFCAFPYPIVMFLGYLTGPSRRRKIREAIEKNEVNLKKKQAYMRKHKRSFR